MALRQPHGTWQAERGVVQAFGLRAGMGVQVGVGRAGVHRLPQRPSLDPRFRQFAEQQGPAVGQISAALTQGDAALAERIAHTLKGVAGNIGAKPVQAAAGALEKLIRARASSTEIEAARGQAAEALDSLLAQLRSALSSAPPGIPQPAAPPLSVDPAQVRAAAAQMTKLLSEFDAAAGEFIEANRGALRPLFSGDAWPQFEKLVQNYAFAEAQALLEQALRNLTAA